MGCPGPGHKETRIYCVFSSLPVRGRGAAQERGQGGSKALEAPITQG